MPRRAFHKLNTGFWSRRLARLHFRDIEPVNLGPDRCHREYVHVEPSLRVLRRSNMTKSVHEKSAQRVCFVKQQLFGNFLNKSYYLSPVIMSGSVIRSRKRWVISAWGDHGFAIFKITFLWKVARSFCSPQTTLLACRCFNEFW